MVKQDNPPQKPLPQKPLKIALGEGQWFAPDLARAYKGKGGSPETLYLTPKWTFVLQSYNSCKIFTGWEACCWLRQNGIELDEHLEGALFPEQDEV